jgi:hypothetical protein
MLVIGCDPGLTGAISLLCSQRGLLECEDLPVCSNGQKSGKMLRWIDAAALQSILWDWSVRHGFAEHSVHACIERPIPMPSMPSTTTASSFDTFGVIRALVTGRVSADGMTVIDPSDWKKLFGLSRDKDASRACALRLYPEAPVKLAKHHNRAEAILIGHWLLREVS